MTTGHAAEQRIPVLRLIARLNVGGPAIQAVNLTSRLEPYGFDTILLRGSLSPGEGSMDHLANELGVQPVTVPGFQRSLGLHDLRALWEVMRWMRRVRPRVLHTHTAKAGAIGRLAAWLTPGHTPEVIVHTFLGLVFEGEFSPRLSRAFARLERLLARKATRIVAVSDEVRGDLIRLGVAPPEKVETVRLGFDLSPFATRDDQRERIGREYRARIGVPLDARLVSVIARVTKVKRIDRFLAMAREISKRNPDVYFAVVGDGDKRAELEASPDAVVLGNRLIWTGFERDIPAVCFASDVVALTSDNEGTPVCLIEAQAAGLPVVTTRVGGVETVVDDGVTGFITDRDPKAIADAVERLLGDSQAAAAMGRRGRERVLETFSVDRLVEDIRSLYDRLLAERLR